MKDNDFYVGYQREAPTGLARFLRPIVTVLVVGGCALSLLITSRQGQFVPSSFEFGMERNFAGVVSLKPYPVLFDVSGAHVLFGAGKHGFTTSAPDVASVRLRGSAVSLGTARGIEVNPETFRASAQSARLPEETHLGRTTMSGEIVDSKCYFGVMNPGRGKVHRDCAVRCISGGLPPTLLVRDESGHLQTVLLSGIAKEELLPYVAERVHVSGDLARRGSLLVLNAASSSIGRE